MISDKKLNYILNFLIKEQPGYILIDGDLIDSVDMILAPNEKDSKLDKRIKRDFKSNNFTWQSWFL